MIPLTIGLIIMGPIAGTLSDKYGPRGIATSGMVLAAISFLILANLPYNFSYMELGVALFLMGAGLGIFNPPNQTAIMNSVPAQE